MTKSVILREVLAQKLQLAPTLPGQAPSHRLAAAVQATEMPMGPEAKKAKDFIAVLPKSVRTGLMAAVGNDGL